MGEKKTSFYEFKLFKNIFDVNSENIRLWLVELENEIIGGTLVFYTKHHAVEWHASFKEKYLRYGVANFIKTEIIKDTCKKGLRYYDFNPSGGHEGVVKFKESLGAKRIDIDCWRWENPAMKILRKL